jgi:hypothetical protein
LCCCGHSSSDFIHKDIIRYARKDFPHLQWFKENRELVGQVIAEDLDAVFRNDNAKIINVPTSDYATNELLCTLDYDNLEKYCTKFLLAMLASLLNLEEIHALDAFAMQSPKEHLLKELTRRGLPADYNLDKIRAGLKITASVARRARPSTP